MPIVATLGASEPCHMISLIDSKQRRHNQSVGLLWRVIYEFIQGFRAENFMSLSRTHCLISNVKMSLRIL